MTLVATVLLCAIAATIALVLVRQTVLLTRSESVRGDYEAAYQDALTVKRQFERELAEDPDFFYHRLFAYERPRLCDGDPVVGPADQENAPPAWPAQCPSTWVYAPADGVVSGADGVSYDPSAHTVRAEIVPPTPRNPQVTLRVLATRGQTETGLTATYRPSTAATVTVYSAGDLRMDAVYGGAVGGAVGAAGSGDSGAAGIVDVNGSVYAGGQIFLPSQAADLGKAQLFAELGFVGALPEGGHFYTNAGITSETPEAVGDIRSAVATPLTLDSLRASYSRLERAGCPDGQPAENTEVDGVTYATNLCLRHGAQLRNTAEDVVVDTTTGVATGDRPAAYLLLYGGTSKKPTVRVYTARTAPATLGECVIRCDLRTLAKADYAAGRHPASSPAQVRSTGDMAKAPLWQPLGEFALPATGVILTDADTYLGQCPAAVDAAATCEATVAQGSVTVVAGSPSDPHDVIIAGGVRGADAGGAESRAARLGLVATRSVVVPFYARRPGGDLTVRANVAALGYGLDGRAALATFPTTQAPVDAAPGNYGGTLTVAGSVAAPDLEADLAGWRHVRVTADPAAAATPPPHFPGFTNSWVPVATDRTSSYDVCGHESCAGTW